jgi:hypothetical protein
VRYVDSAEFVMANGFKLKSGIAVKGGQNSANGIHALVT